VLLGAVSHAAIDEEDGKMSRLMTMLVLTALLCGFTACAKYPVLVNASAPSPTAATQAPTR
jgi:hypothetical protein